MTPTNVIGIRPTTFLDKDTNTVPGTYTFQVSAIGGHDRLSEPATAMLAVAAIETPTFTALSPRRATVVVTPQLLATTPAGSAWMVYRNGLLQRTVTIQATTVAPTPVTLTFQPSGRFTYAIRLVTPDGTSALSPAVEVVVKTV